MKDQRTPGYPANLIEAHSSTKPAADAGQTPTTGATSIGKVRCAVLTERVRAHVGIICTSLDIIMNQPDLSTGIQKQALIAWLMIEHSSLPYHEPPEPIFSEALLDEILKLLSAALRSDEESGGGGDDGTDDEETTVVPQPVGPETPDAGTSRSEVPSPKSHRRPK